MLTVDPCLILARKVFPRGKYSKCFLEFQEHCGSVGALKDKTNVENALLVLFGICCCKAKKCVIDEN